MRASGISPIAALPSDIAAKVEEFPALQAVVRSASCKQSRRRFYLTPAQVTPSVRRADDAAPRAMYVATSPGAGSGGAVSSAQQSPLAISPREAISGGGAATQSASPTEPPADEEFLTLPYDSFVKLLRALNVCMRATEFTRSIAALSIDILELHGSKNNYTFSKDPALGRVAHEAVRADLDAQRRARPKAIGVLLAGKVSFSAASKFVHKYLSLAYPRLMLSAAACRDSRADLMTGVQLINDECRSIMDELMDASRLPDLVAGGFVQPVDSAALTLDLSMMRAEISRLKAEIQMLKALNEYHAARPPARLSDAAGGSHAGSDSGLGGRHHSIAGVGAGVGDRSLSGLDAAALQRTSLGHSSLNDGSVLQRDAAAKRPRSLTHRGGHGGPQRDGRGDAKTSSIYLLSSQRNKVVRREVVSSNTAQVCIGFSDHSLDAEPVSAVVPLERNSMINCGRRRGGAASARSSSARSSVFSGLSGHPAGSFAREDLRLNGHLANTSLTFSDIFNSSQVLVSGRENARSSVFEAQPRSKSAHTRSATHATVRPRVYDAMTPRTRRLISMAARPKGLGGAAQEELSTAYRLVDELSVRLQEEVDRRSSMHTENSALRLSIKNQKRLYDKVIKDIGLENTSLRASIRRLENARH